ncbi:MAG: hypothetical protein UR99_C0031G0007 [Candidatus Moranbacteria bacterium GW2011_GWD2_36_12]|nr:MAG: hypothetical protein UR99_C0031G0007 [Candidatus Moranbacteria bacterium GW2011_GWD2_36_12]KKQ06723.1 MAG: hypothetical protein US16_C0010G0007 [Candidatus Moranbacteria bacterium GW2011_GWE2_36_40]
MLQKLAPNAAVLLKNITNKLYTTKACFETARQTVL